MQDISMRPIEIEMIYKINRLLECTTDFNEVMEAALKMVMNSTEADAGTIWLLAEDKTHLYPYIIQGTHSKYLRSFKLAYGEGVAGWVTAHRQPRIVEDCSHDESFSSSADKMAGYVTRTMICVPLCTEEHTFGCIQIINKADGGLFTKNDCAVCAAFAVLVSSNIVIRGLPVVPASKPPILEMTKIKKTYAGIRSSPYDKESNRYERAVILKDISMTLYEHEFLLILGTSGAGKSTLLKILGGMENASDGSFTVDGCEFAKASPRARAAYRRDRIGFIFQSYNLMSNLTAYENIRLALEIAGKPVSRIDEYLDWVGLREKRNHFPQQMSGGEQQRVAIARALVKEPEIILADEPTGALDEKTGTDIMVLLERIAREKLGTVVMISHNPSFIPVADRVIRINSGSITQIIQNPYPVPVRKLVTR